MKWFDSMASTMADALKQIKEILMADQPGPMHIATRIGLLVYLLVSSALFLYFLYGLWAAVPAPIAQQPVDPPDLTGQAGPKDGTPQIVQIDPERFMVGANRPTVRIFGHNFKDASQARFDDAVRQTRHINQHELVVALGNSDDENPGAIVVSVANKDQKSNEVTLLVESRGETTGTWKIFYWTKTLSQELRLLLLVIFTGAFGACIMALRSLADYRGQRKLTNNWTIHYVVRPTSGAGVAFVFYLVIRGGFMAGTDVDIGASAPFGIVAVAALAGMFSEKAFNKLGEVFNAMFKADDRGEGLGALAIETITLPDAETAKAYSQQLNASGGKPPYKWSVANNPSWLQLDANTGKLSVSSGTTTQPKANFTVTVTDDDGTTASLTLTLAVK
jgi:hypothetical protein